MHPYKGVIHDPLSIVADESKLIAFESVQPSLEYNIVKDVSTEHPKLLVILSEYEPEFILKISSILEIN